MLNELTSKQCDAFMQEHDVKVRRTCYGIRDTHPWYCGDSTKKCPNYVGKTREAVITKYWLEYHPDWTPPVIHDEAWALRYMTEIPLLINCHNDGSFSISAASGSKYDHEDSERIPSGTVVDAILKWKAKYDPDKPEPTREETAMGLLRKVVKADETDGGNFETLVRALTKAREFIDRQETDHVD